MEEEPLPLSALQHWLYCPRQCALIHLERLWAENRFTAEGRLLHEASDLPGRSRRGGRVELRALPLACRRLGLAGVADVVELHEGRPFPVEYKRGRPKAHRADEVQLCAQALCLEEMFACPVPEGALFYGQNRRRQPVAFDAALRRLTEESAAAVARLFAEGRTPPPHYEKGKCAACSLAALCHPQGLAGRDARRWLERRLLADARAPDGERAEERAEERDGEPGGSPAA